jgi:hypothetical protein
LGLALGHDAWDDTGTYEKNTTYLSASLSGARVRVTALTEFVRSETTAELTGLRRTTALSFDGSGYGAELAFDGDRVSLHASYLAYEYDDTVSRLLNFLASPTLTDRPRLDGLLGSGLTAAAALLDYSATVGADFYVGDSRIGISWLALRDIVSDGDAQSLRAEFQWPLSDHWSARLVGGVSDSDVDGSTFFGGVRFLFHSN